MSLDQVEWRIAWTMMFNRVRIWKSELPAKHCRGGLSDWDRRASKYFNFGYSIEGAKPMRVLEETLDQLYYEMFNGKTD